MLTFELDYDLRQTDPKATLQIRYDILEQVYLSIANRTVRNRRALYQRKHAGALFATRQREQAFADLNNSIPNHYELLVSEHRIAATSPVLAFPISDLTANPLRPHYDAAAIEPLFHLEDEPIGGVPYTLLFCYHDRAVIRFAVLHDVRVAADGSLPNDIPPPVSSGLNWWAACPPLLRRGEHSLEDFALRDYDLRHVFGFPKDEADEEALREMYRLFPDWDRWCAAIRTRLRTIERYETGYHAALGVSGDRLILIHRSATIPDLARELQTLGADDAVLLDSGGSCAIWANWANGGEGGVLASHWNFRAPRGAVVFLVLNGRRRPERPARLDRPVAPTV